MKAKRSLVLYVRMSERMRVFIAFLLWLGRARGYLYAGDTKRTHPANKVHAKYANKKKRARPFERSNPILSDEIGD